MWVLGGAVGVVDEVAMGSATSVGTKRWDSMERALDESAMEVVWRGRLSTFPAGVAGLLQPASTTSETSVVREN